MSVFLSDIELYFSPASNFKNDTGKITGDECKHILKVMRHKIDDEIYVTNGLGKIFKCKINSIDKGQINFSVNDFYEYENSCNNLYFCIPLLKNNDRFEFALEKCVELGITNFIIYNADKSISKSVKVERWNKILVSAMKQSLRCYLPKLEYKNNLQKISEINGEKIIYDQKAETVFKDIHLDKTQKIFFIFGPEGGLSKEELDLFSDSIKAKLSNYRLRTETAIVTAGGMIN